MPPREERTTARKWRPKLMQPFRCLRFFSAVRLVKRDSEDRAAAIKKVGSKGQEIVKSRVVMGGDREISSMTRSPMVPVRVLVLRRSCFHDEDPGWSWLAVRAPCRTRALCLLWREPVTPQDSGW
jgi:hypothetical protein